MTTATVINQHHSMRRRVLAIAGIAAAAAAVVPATTAFASAPASHPTVACDYWRGAHYVGHPFGAVKPSVLGAKTGTPVQNITWTSWGQNSATGHGKIVRMGTYHVTVRLHNARSHDGVRHFTVLTGTGQLAWSQSWPTNCR